MTNIKITTIEDIDEAIARRNEYLKEKLDAEDEKNCIGHDPEPNKVGEILWNQR